MDSRAPRQPFRYRKTTRYKPRDAKPSRRPAPQSPECVKARNRSQSEKLNNHPLENFVTCWLKIITEKKSFEVIRKTISRTKSWIDESQKARATSFCLIH